MDDKNNDRPAIEVTPEMIEEGLLHLYRWHPDTGVGDEDTVTRIFFAMLSRLPPSTMQPVWTASRSAEERR